MAGFFWFSDAQWVRIAPLLPTDARGKPRVDDRRVLTGIVHALREWLDERGAEAVIPPRRNRKLQYDYVRSIVGA